MIRLAEMDRLKRAQWLNVRKEYELVSKLQEGYRSKAGEHSSSEALDYKYIIYFLKALLEIQ